MAADSSSDTQALVLKVNAISELAITGSTVTMTVVGAPAGSGLTAVDDSTTKYAVTTNGTGMKITGVLDSAMPTDTTLTIALAAPTLEGCSSAGPVSLSDTAADLVTGITTLSASDLGITYELGALLTAGPVGTFDRTVTLTMVAGS
jgi:hypothetical protein